MNKTNGKKSFCNNYISMKAYINKIRSACHKRDILATSYAATELQIWIAEELAQYIGSLIVNVDNFNFFEEIKAFYSQVTLPDLMEGITRMDFQEILKNVAELDLQLQDYCKKQNYKPPSFFSLDEVEAHLR